MSTLPTEISGTEVIDDPTSPLAALSAFYRAFNSKDLDALAQVWLDDDEPGMSNPVGGLRRGWSDIRDGYARLFGGAARVQVIFHDFTTHGDDRSCAFVGREKAPANHRPAHSPCASERRGGSFAAMACGDNCIITVQSKSLHCLPTISVSFSARRSGQAISHQLTA